MIFPLVPAKAGTQIVADDLAVLVDADLARYEDEFRRPDAGEVGILPERLAERVGIENLDVGHRQIPFLAPGHSIETPLALIGAAHFLISSAVNVAR